MPGHPTQQEEFARQVGEWVRHMSVAGVSPSESSTSNEAGEATGRPEGAPGDGLSELSFLWVQSGLRLWTRCAEVWVKLGLAAVQNVSRAQTEAGAGEDTRNVLIAELRSALRELTTVSSQEARRLDAELEKLERRGRPDAPGDESGPYWRRWEVKR
jgi:hypothetical protein